MISTRSLAEFPVAFSIANIEVLVQGKILNSIVILNQLQSQKKTKKQSVAKHCYSNPKNHIVQLEKFAKLPPLI